MPDFNTLVGWATIIIVPLTIVAIVVTVWGIRRGWQKRALACEFQSVEFPIEVKAGEALGGDIEIRFQGKPIDNLFVVRFRLKNTGSLPIRKEHIIEHLKFAFETNTKLLRLPEILEKKPKNLKTNWDDKTLMNSLWDYVEEASVDIKHIFLQFDLFNPNEELTAEFLCTGEVSTPSISARIEGLKRVDVFDPNELSLRSKFKSELKEAVVVLVIVFVVLGVLFLFFGNIWIILTSLSVVVIAMFISPTVWLLNLVRYRRKLGK